METAVKSHVLVSFCLPFQDRKSAALKKIIASMTVGKDVSELFPDVAKCISTEERDCGRGSRNGRSNRAIWHSK